MMLRLAMVGFVAALGVTIPSQTECDNWFSATQRWASSAFAEWDGWRPQERVGDPGPVEVAEHECEQCRMARLAVMHRDPISEAGAALIDSASTGTVADSAGTDERADRADNAATPAPPASALPPVSIQVVSSDGFTVDHALELTWNVDGNDVAESPAPLAGSQARAEWAALEREA